MCASPHCHSTLPTTMCKRNWNSENDTRPERPESSPADRPKAASPYDHDIDQVFERVGLVTNHLADWTKKVVGHTYDFAHARDWDALAWPYQQRDADLNRGYGPWQLLSVFGDGSPYGLAARGNPSTRQYNECLRKDGRSVWDARGDWRCLFPNREVPVAVLDYKNAHLADQILTKEDFDAAAKSATGPAYDLGPKGLFFSHYNAYLDWKNKGYEAARVRREQARAELAERAGGPGPVVSSSVRSSMDSDGAETVLKEVRTEVFADGTSVTKNITKTKPAGAAEWATVTEDTQEGRGGWFWN